MSETAEVTQPKPFNIPATREARQARAALLKEQVAHLRARLLRQMARGESQKLSRRIKVNTAHLGDMQQELFALANAK